MDLLSIPSTVRLRVFSPFDTLNGFSDLQPQVFWCQVYLWTPLNMVFVMDKL